MRRKPLAFLVLLALLCLAPSARALSVPGAPAVPPVLAAPADEEEEEGEAAASEDEEDEEAEAAEACEPEEPGECDEEAGSEAPAECLLGSVDPKIFASGNSGKVRLQIRYTTNAPTAVAIEYGLHGAKGSLFLGKAKRRLARKGVLRLSRRLTETQMAKVMAARDFTVRLRVPAAPAWCRPYFDRHLDVRRATPRGLTWLPSE
jgi:hypothetical protein